MLHPIGSKPATTYWRRRLVILGAPLLLIVITGWVLLSNGSGGSANAGAGPSAATTSSPAGSPSSASSGSSTSASSSSAKASPSTSGKTSGSATGAPATCVQSQLRISAATSAASYHVGDEPVVMLQVVNAGPKPCTQDLADNQVELRVYNGTSRVWGSHDCQVEPGTAVRTLPVGQVVRVSITWSGLSSEPGCAGTRQRVGAGTYTLYPYLSGHVGTAAQFSIT